VAVANQKNILFYLKILSVHNCQVQVRKKRDKTFEYIDLIIRDVKIKKVHASKNKKDALSWTAPSPKKKMKGSLSSLTKALA